MTITVTDATEKTTLPATGHYYFAEWTGGVTGPVAAPADYNDPTAAGAGPFVDLGSTSLDAPFGISSDGGDSTTLGTWQNKSKRVSHADRTEKIAFVLQDWTGDNYRLYWGANAHLDSTTGLWMTPADPVEVEGTLFVVVSDGSDILPLYFPHVSIFRADDIAFDAEALAGLPVAATVLGVDSSTDLYGVGVKGQYVSA